MGDFRSRASKAGIGMGTLPVEKPSTTYFSLAKRYVSLRERKTAPYYSIRLKSGKVLWRGGGNLDWLRELPSNVIKRSLDHQAQAWKRYFTVSGAGRPRIKRKVSVPRFTIARDATQKIVRDGCLYIPKIGRLPLRRRRGVDYEDCRVVEASCWSERGKWYASLCYKVPEDRVAPADNGAAVAIDMNAGQVGISTGEIIELPDSLKRLEARRRRYQRMVSRRRKGSNRRRKAIGLMRKTSRKIMKVRHDWAHRVSRALADTAGTVVFENLKTRNMTRSAKGTVEKPGSRVKQKAGLNRVILATAWARLRQMVEYKAAQPVAVPPAYTSQTCFECGAVDAKSRRSQSVFECVHCGHRANADVNAALNILASEPGAAGRGAALPLGTALIRQNPACADWIRAADRVLAS